MITTKELRQKFLDFFATKGHKIISSASLIPENDPTVLFTTAGMQPLVPYLMGERHPEGTRLVDVQKCIRTNDIDEVGDGSHMTFFEMLGNWSLGDYFKDESIAWSFEFLTDAKWLNLPIEKLAVTVFEGDETVERDDESAKKWLALGIPKNRIAYLPKKNNWWAPAGTTGPCGPDTEIFYWRGEGTPPADSNPGNDEDNWLEIWNNVFMQFNKNADNTYSPLAQKNVDTGMGLERTTMVLGGGTDPYMLDSVWPIIQKIQELSGREYIERPEVTRAMRIMADHLRAAVMIIGDDAGVAPSNTDQGYIVRRLLRRAVRYGRVIGLTENFCSELAEVVIKIFNDIYPEVRRNKEFIILEIAKEESKFRNTIEQGIKEFEKLMNGFRMAFEKTGKNISEISGKQAFKLYDTYGFPLEMTMEMAIENGMTVNVNDFDEAFKKHQELSRAGAEQKFKGGLADDGEMSRKYHTATHLLLAALRQLLSEEIYQKGSNITSERLRFDFNYPEKLNPEQIQAIEDLVNKKIEEDITVEMVEMPKAEALKLAKVSFDPSKYGDVVKIYKIGDFSIELCGGPHATRTGELGKFKIQKEESSSSGIRRIKAVLI